MLHYNNLENLKLYKSNRLFLPLDESSKKKNMNTLIYLNTSSLDSSINIINSKMFFNKMYFRSYFVDYIYRFKLFNKQVVKKLDTKDYYLRAVKETKFITKTYKFAKNYKQKNLFTDLSVYNELFKDKIGFRKGNIVIKEYLKMLSEINNKFEYNKKVMIFDLQDWKFDTKDTKNYKYSSATEPIQMIYAAMYRFPDEFKKLNFDILLVNKNFFIKLVPSKCDGKSFQKLRTQMNKMRVKNTFNILEPEPEKENTETEPSNDKKEKTESMKSIMADELERDMLKKININDKTDEILDIKKFSFTGDVDLEETEPEVKIESKIKKEVEKISTEITPDEDLDDEDLERLKTELKEKLNEDEEFLKELELIKSEKVANISANNIKRNKLLEEKQAKIKINGKGKTIDDILEEIQEKTIMPKEIKVDTMNENIKKMKLINFENQYNEKLLEKDTIAIINFFKSLSVPVYILDIKKEDTSDQFNKKFTYTVKMESCDRERHTVKFDIPKFVEDKFLYLNGNKKNIIHQLILKPISKTGPNTVQICTGYNKAFLSRSGTKVSPKIERMKKALVQFESRNLKTKVGNNLKSNLKYKTTMEYDEIGANYMNVILNNEIFLYFNQAQIRTYLTKNNIKYTKNNTDTIPIGYIIKNGKKEALELDTNKDEILKYKKSICDFITDEISKKVPDFKNQMNKLTVGKKFICTKVKIMRKDVPLLLLLSYLEGLTAIMQKAEINFTFSDTRPILKDDKNDKDIIEFKDGYLIFDRYPMRNSLLMNSLSLIPTKEYDFADFDEKETYLEIFENLLGMRMIANAFNNFYDLLIDPISKEVLQDLNLPTDFSGVMLYANALLEDNVYTKENDMSLYRLRSNEMVNSYLYKALADSYAKYRATANNKNPVKMSIPQNEVVKNILMSPNVEDYSTLNPILEAEKTRAVTCKGPNGMNQERAYTIDKRAYDKSMKGILAMSSPPTGNVGVVRQLSLDAEVLSPRGYMKTNSSDDELNSVNLFSPAELLTPMCATKDDAPRVAMTSIQSKHIIPCKKYDKLLMGDGTEKALSKIISDDFAFKAKEDGTIKELHEDLDFFVVEYKNGETDIIETGNKISKNGGGGFYINNKLKTNFKEGEKFKKDDVLAYNDKFFNQNDKSEATLQVGTLAKVAIMSGYFNYEDSGIITHKLCDEMATNVIMKKDISLGKNSNIEYIVSKGQEVEVGDPLLVFDESYDDEGLNKMLAGMGSVGDEIQNLGKVPVRSKYSGTVEDIKIYSTVDINELSPSLQKLVKQLNEPLVKAEKIIKKYKEAKDLVLTISPTNKKIETPDGKIKGVEVNDGVLIEIYINYTDKMGVGDLDKVSLYSNIQRTIFLIAGNSLEL